MLKYAAILIGISGIVAGGLIIQRQSQPLAERAVAPVGPTTIYAAGRIEGATEEIRLRPQIDGRIVQLAVVETQMVSAGDLLLQVDDRAYQQEVELAKAELKQHQASLARLHNGARPEERQEAAAMFRASEADLERAELTWERIRRLREGRAVSQEEADNQRTMVAELKAKRDAAKAHFDVISSPAREDEVAREEARVAAAQARLDLAKVQLEWTRLVAPTDGQILQVNVRAGELTSIDSPIPPVIFADTRRYRVARLRRRVRCATSQDRLESQGGN